MVTGQLNRFSPEQRAVAEAVAVAGAVPVELLLGTAASEVIDELQTQGILRATTAHRRCSPGPRSLWGSSAFPACLTPRRELLLKLVEAPHTSPLPGTSRMALANWCLDNGIDQEPPALVDAARIANDIHQPDAALTFIGALENAGRDPHAVLETARALAITGEVDAAIQVLDPLLGSPAAAATETGLWVALLLTQARLVLRSHGRHAEADSLLAEVRARIEKETSPEEPLLELIEAADDFAAERDLFEGRCAAVVESASVLSNSASTGTAPPTTLPDCSPRPLP
jgi:hypothetical protein